MVHKSLGLGIVLCTLDQGDRGLIFYYCSSHTSLNPSQPFVARYFSFVPLGMISLGCPKRRRAKISFTSKGVCIWDITCLIAVESLSSSHAANANKPICLIEEGNSISCISFRNDNLFQFSEPKCFCTN